MFNLAEIYLKKLNFKLLRENLLNAEGIKIESKVDMNGKFIRENNTLATKLDMSIKGFDNSFEIIDIFISIEGLFVAVDENPNLLEEKEIIEIFSKVKAPQIMFPFLVENIHNLTLRAKVKPIIIPYIDFQKLYNENKEFSNSIH